MARKQLNNLLIKPAGADCNLRCEYCFYLEKCALYPDTKQRRMSDEVLSATVEQLMVLGGDNPSFGWQGGEPTLMGLDFFKRAVEYQQRFGYEGQAVGNGLQTNGVLIDEEWADFLKEYNFLVGLSLDGPKHVHDHYRHNVAGHDTWERVRDTGRLLRERGAEANALVVVSDYSARFPEEIYDFLREEGFDFMQFIPIVETSADGQGAAPFSLTSEALGEFFCRIFDRWVADFRDGLPMVSIRWFDSLLYTYVGLPAPECTMQPECGVYLCIEHTGDVYPCDFFVEKERRLGNVLTDRLDHLLNGLEMTAFGREKLNLPPECDGCKWHPHCYGGCVKDRIKDRRDRGSNHFCEGIKTFLEHSDQTFKRLAAQWKREQARRERHEEAVARQGAPGASAQRDMVGAAASAMNPGNRGAGAKVGRNAPCPCGSGRKYKRCCGKT